MNKRYAISDIHGNYRTFLRALDHLQLAPNDTLFLLGDYVDKGPDSRQLINHIQALQADGYQINCLLGNHELYMLRALEAQSLETDFFQWLKAGGDTTFPNYTQGAEAKNFHPDLDQHIEWMRSLPALIELEDYWLVHAGFNFRAPDFLMDYNAMLFIRHWYGDLDASRLEGKAIIHGHTPMPKSAVSRQADTKIHKLPVFNIDAGCFFHREGYGHLAVFDLDDRTFHFFRNEDMPLGAIRRSMAAKNPTV